MVLDSHLELAERRTDIVLDEVKAKIRIYHKGARRAALRFTKDFTSKGTEKALNEVNRLI